MKPLDLLDRLETLLEDTVSSVEIIDMDDIHAKRRALNICRAPAVDWDKYAKGKEYKPPTYAHDTTKIIGPPANRGAEETGYKVIDNPHSREWGGVRPWSPAEIVETMMDETKTEGMFPYGLRSIIRKFEHMHHAARPGVPFRSTDKYEGADQEAFLAAVDALYIAILKDKGRVGTEFTKYLSLHMDLSGGAAPGLRGEHRTMRGILTKLDEMLPRIAAQVSMEGYDADAVIDMFGKLGSKDIKLRDANPEIDWKENKFGRWAGEMKTLYENLSEMVRNGDAQGILAMRQRVENLYDDIETQEAQYSGHGLAHGSLGSQPRDLPAIGTSAHRLKAEVYNVFTVDPDTDQMDQEKLNKPGELKPEDVVLKRTPEGKLAIRRLPDVKADSLARAESNAKAAYATETGLPKQLVNLLPFRLRVSALESGAGFSGITGTTIKGEEGEDIEHPELGRLVMNAETDPELKDELTNILYQLRYGSSKQREGQAHRAIDVIKHLMSIIEHSVEPKPRPNLKAVPDTRNARLTDPTATRDEISTRRAMAGGYNIVDVDKNQIVARADDEQEAARMLEQFNNPVMSSLRYVSNALTRPKVGEEYYEELIDIAKMVAIGVRDEDQEALADAAEELRIALGAAKMDLEEGGKSKPPMITELQYRIALRKLGISNYPEKGTVNDPEIDENGHLSLWAQAGYPLVQKDTGPGGKGQMTGTLYAPGEEDYGEMMTDKHIARDLGISPQSVGNNWRKLEQILSALAHQLYEHHVWAGDLDAVDLRLLRETCVKLAMILLEDHCHEARLLRG